MSKNLTSLGYCHPDLSDKLEVFERSLLEAGIEYKRLETYRTGRRQMDLYAQGRTKPGDIVTFATAASSPHCKTVMRVPVSCAADYMIYAHGDPCLHASPLNDDMWSCFGELARRAGLIWGGDWIKIRDFGHVELKNWRALK
jgi:peptidoglycan L-alanyl-D-glutamate endopeptidase CwlK